MVPRIHMLQLLLVVPAVAVMVLGQVAEWEIHLALLLLRVILVVRVLTTSLGIMAVAAAVALALLAILVSIMVRTWQEPLKVGVVKVYNTLLSVTVMAPVVMVTNISQVAAVAISLRVGYLQHNHRRLELM